MSQPAVNDIATSLNSNYKQTYADSISMVIPEGVRGIKDIKFVEGDQVQGGQYNQPVAMALEHGMTYAAGDVAVNLNAAVSGKLENATITGYQMVMRAQISYPVASRSAKGPNYFRNGAGLVLENMMLSHKKRAEAAVWYGQSGLTTVSSVSGSDITCTSAEWADGLWVGMVNAPIDVYTSGGVFRQSCNITKVDSLNKKITVDNIGAIASTDVIYYRGAFGNEPLGVHKILTSTGGTLFNISQTTYADLWTGTSYAVSGQLTFQKVMQAAAMALPRGGEGRFKVYTHPMSFQDLVNEPELARTNSDYWTPTVFERGSDGLKFHSVAGIVEVVPCTYIKRGYAYGLLQDGSWKRIGSTDVVPYIPGLQDKEKVFLHMPNTNAVEIRSYSDFATFCDRVAASFAITGIVPSA